MAPGVRLFGMADQCLERAMPAIGQRLRVGLVKVRSGPPPGGRQPGAIGVVVSRYRAHLQKMVQRHFGI